MVIYNFSTQTWSNVSADALSYYGTTVDGSAQIVPSFGPNGLMLVLGGRSKLDGTTKSYYPFDNIPIYEPLSQKWTAQKTTGEAPPTHENGCAVGVEGDNGTYEVCSFNIITTFARLTHGLTDIHLWRVFVRQLREQCGTKRRSRPLTSFHWQKISTSPGYGRYRHTCNVIGNRQMVIVGGQIVDPKYADTASATDNTLGPDPWPKGFGIFDLSALEFTSKYDSSAAPYVTPEVVKSHIKENGQYPASWSDPVVQTWFNKESR